MNKFNKNNEFRGGPQNRRPGNSNNSWFELFNKFTRTQLKLMMRQCGIQPTDATIRQFEKWRLQRDVREFVREQREGITQVAEQIRKQPLAFVNGKAGEPYAEVVSFEPGVLDKVTLRSVEGLDGSGLKLVREGDKLRLEGIPTVGCDYAVTLRFEIRNFDGTVVEVKRTFAWAVNPDPRLLWRDIPTGRDIPYYKADTDCAYCKVETVDGKPKKDMVAASHRGRSHAHEGKPRDDDFRLEYLAESGWYLMAVADGAGSAKYSREGSRLACEAAVDHLKTSLAKDSGLDTALAAYAQEKKQEKANQVGQTAKQVMAGAAYKAHRAIAHHVEAQKEKIADIKMRDFGTTLLLAAAKYVEEAGWVIATFWVGDGAVAIYNPDSPDAERRLILMGTPDGGEYAGQTRFVTMPEVVDEKSIYSRVGVKIVPDFKALLLMTDGVSDAKFDCDADLGRLEPWNRLWKDITDEVKLEDDREEAKEELLEWLKFWSKGNHDDRTIAILY